MAFLNVSPTPIPEYIGEVQDVGTASAVSGSGSFDLDTDDKKKPKTEPVKVKVPERSPVKVKVPERSPVLQPQPDIFALPSLKPTTEPAWKPSPVTEPVKVKVPERPSVFQPQSDIFALPSLQPTTEPAWKPSSNTGTARQPVDAPQEGFKPATSLATFSTLAANTGTKSILDSVNRTDPVKEASAKAKPFRNPPQYDTTPVKSSLFDGSAQSVQNLQNATAFLSSLFGGSGKGISKETASIIVEGTRALGKAELNVLENVGKLAGGKTVVDTFGKAVGTEVLKDALKAFGRAY